MMSIDQTAFEADIVTACTKHKKEHWRDDDYRACVVIKPGYFVKYDSYKTLQPQIATQSYISHYAESQADAPRIPKVIHHFEGDQGRGYFVMEYIKLSDPSPSDLPERAAEAVKWLAGVPAPPEHVTKCALTMLSTLRKQPVEPVRFSGEPLIFTQSDMDPSNFGVDDSGNTVLLDFGEIGLLPTSFAIFTMSLGTIFTAAVAKFLGWSGSSNLASMAVISHCLWQVSDPRLGLNENGNPKKKAADDNRRG